MAYSDPAIAIGGTKLDLKYFGKGIIVPVDPQSHLMYYMSCINTLLKPKGQQSDANMKKLCNYKHYYMLTEDEVDQLILLCFILSPDILLDKCIFTCDELCQDYDNNFYEINAVSHRFVITRELLVGGETRSVQRIMACRKCWLDENWVKPMEHYKDRLQRILTSDSQPTSAGQQRQAVGQNRRPPRQQRQERSTAVARPRPRQTTQPVTPRTPTPPEEPKSKYSCSIM